VFTPVVSRQPPTRQASRYRCQKFRWTVFLRELPCPVSVERTVKEPFLPPSRRPDYRSPITDLPRRSCAKAGYHSLLLRERGRAVCRDVALREGGFTLIELLVVIGIIGLLMVLVIPAFTSIKTGTDITSAAYTVKGVLDTARTYAKANNTYTWVGFLEENVSNPSSPNSDTPPVGRLIISIVASSDGTMIYDPDDPAKITTTKLIQVGKLTKIENIHLASNLPTFDARPTVTYDDARIGDTTPLNPSLTPFQYPVGNPEPAEQYTFVKAVQFSPGGEARVNNSTSSYSLRPAAEIGLRPTHGTAIDTSSPNVVAIQFTGVGGNVTIYRK
jgi:prepilin-type N-terminal cleavage/methylation domain-containing protein